MAADKHSAALAWLGQPGAPEDPIDTAPPPTSGSAALDAGRNWLSLVEPTFEDEPPPAVPSAFEDNPMMAAARNWLMPVSAPEPEGEPGAFERGIYGGYNTLISIFGGAASFTGDIFNDESIQSWGRDIAREYGARSAKWAGQTPSIDHVFSDEGGFGDFMTWAGYHVASGGVTAAPALLAGALGAITSPAVALGAGGAFLYGMGVGDITATQLEDRDDPDLRWAAIGGVPYAVAERLFGAGAIAARALTGQQRRALATSLLRRLGRNIPGAMAGEATAESVQTLITEGVRRLEAGEDAATVLGSSELWRAIAEGAAAGAVGGGPFGAVAAIPGPRVGDPSQVAPVAPGEAPAPGTRANRPEAPPPSQADIDSPLDTDDIQAGRQIMVDADAATTADAILRAVGWPSVGTEVVVQGRLISGGKPFEGRIVDAAQVEGEAVATVVDSRTGVTHYIDQGMQPQITVLPPPEQRQAQAEAEDQRGELERIRQDAIDTGFETVFNQARWDELQRRNAIDFEEVEQGQRAQVVAAVQKRVQEAQQNVAKAEKDADQRQRQAAKETERAEAARQKELERVAREDEKATKERQKAEKDRQKEADAQLVYRQQSEAAYTESEDLGAEWQAEAEERVRKQMGVEAEHDIDTDRDRRGTYLQLYKGEVQAERARLKREEKAEKEKEKAALPAPTRPVERAEGEPGPSAGTAPAPRPAPRGRPVGEASEVITPAGRRVPVQPEIIEGADLVASHDAGGTVNPAFPTALQPRDRSRAASQTQILAMASKIEPELLMPAAQSAEGAPIIGPDNVVESGNARTLALALAYAQHPESAKAYREHLEKQGYDTEGMTAPVLVQRRTGEMTPEERQEFAREANVRTTAERSASEQASADAKGVDVFALARYQGGGLDLAANRDFVRAVIDKAIPETERGGMMTAAGELSQAGRARIENALFMKAYGDAELLAKLREEGETHIKSIGKAMIEVAPWWAQMREAAQGDAIASEMDTTDQLVAAARIVDRARTEGRDVAEFVNQTDFLTGSDLDPLTESFLALFFRNTKQWIHPIRQDRIVLGLETYINEALKTSTTPDMFGAKLTPAEIAAAAREKQYADEKKKQQQRDLLKAAQSPGKGTAGAGRAGGGRGAERAGAPEGRGDAATGRDARRGPRPGVTEAKAANNQPYWDYTEQLQWDTADAADLHQAARDWVLERGAQAGHEYLVMVDTTNNTITDAGTGKRDGQVVFTRDLSNRLDDSTAEFVGHHNHPSHSSLSPGDVAILFRHFQMKQIFAHTERDSSSARLSATMTKAMAGQDTTGRINAMTAYQRAASTLFHGGWGMMSNHVNARKLSTEDAQRYHAHMMNLVMHRRGLIEYESTMVLPDNAEYAETLAHMEAMADVEIERVFKEVRGVRRDNRPAIRLRPDRGVGEAFGFAEAHPRPDRVRPQRGPPRKADDRVQAEGSQLREERLTFTDPETQKAWERGLKGRRGAEAPLVGRVGAYIKYFGQLWVRSYKHLPKTPEFAEAHESLRKVAAAPSVATEEVVRYLHDLTRGMSQADLELFTMKTVVDDLQHDVAQDMEIPIFRDPADFARERARVEAEIAKRPDLMARVHKRRRYVNKVKRRMIEAGLLKETDAANPAYFHHAVLEYAPASKAFGGTKKLSKPTLYRRKGTKLTINTKLVEAESEWLFRALTGIATMKAIDEIGAKYDKAADVKEAVREHNKVAMAEIVRTELDAAVKMVGAPEGTPLSELSPAQAAALKTLRPIHAQLQMYRRNIALGLKTLRGDKTLTADMLPKHLRADFAAMMAGENDGELNFPLIAWIAQNLDTDGAVGAATVLKAVSSRRQFLKDTLGEKYMNPGNLDRTLKAFGNQDQWKTWQPDEGRVLFMAKTIPEHVMDRYLAHLAQNLGEQSGHFTNEEMAALLQSVKDQLVLGGKKPQMVLPTELVDTLEDMGGVAEQGPISDLFARVVRLHKQWLLISPRTWFRYNLQNISGDFDGALAAFPAAIRPRKYMGPVIAELWKVQIKRQAPSAAYLDAAERGVFDAGWSINEVYEAEANIGDVMNTRNFTEKNLRRVWRFFSRSTTFRENWLRYAMYKAVLDKINEAEAKHPGQPPKMIMPMIGYGAAKAEMVDALADPRDRAALIARESIGDYGQISVAGDYLRHRWLWFFSWQEINFKRYFRLGQNIWLTQQGFGRQQALAKLGSRVGIRTAMWLAFRAGLFFAAVQIWNHLFFPEEEEELSEEDRYRLHVILGRDADGKVIAVKMPGALSDFLGVFGYTDVAQAIAETQRGRGSFTDILEHIALAPINRLVGGVTPILKVPVEALTGQTTFPKFWEPRTVKDPWRHIFRTFKMEHEYDAVLGRPSRGYFHSWAEAGVSRRDPGENAYHYIRGLGYDYRKTVKGQDFRGQGFDPRSRAIYYYRKALQFDDATAARKFRRELRKMGVDAKSMASSIRNMHPLGMLPKKDRGRFLRSLTTEERRRLRRATAWYNRTFR